MSLLLARLVAAISGTLAKTNASDTSAAAGGHGPSGTSVTTNVSDVSAAAGVVSPAPDAGSHSGGFPKPRRFPTPPRLPWTPPPISGGLFHTNKPDTVFAFGEFDPLKLLLDDEELLVLV